MVSQSVWHPADISMVVVEDARITLARTAVMNDDVLPAIARHARIVDSLSHRRCEILPVHVAAAARGGHKVFLLFRAGFLNYDRIAVVMLKKEPTMLLFLSDSGCLTLRRWCWRALWRCRCRGCAGSLLGFCSFNLPDARAGLDWLPRVGLRRRWRKRLLDWRRSRIRPRFWSRGGAWDNFHLLATLQKEFAQTFFLVRLLRDTEWCSKTQQDRQRDQGNL